MNLLGIASFNGKFVPFKEYDGIMRSLTEKIQMGTIPGCSNFADFSHDAYITNDGISTRDTSNGSNSRPIISSVTYWTFSPGENASKWQLCINDGIMCIGWDALGDLSHYASHAGAIRQGNLA